MDHLLLILFLWPWCSLCCFSLFLLPPLSLRGIFCPFLNTFPQRCHQLSCWSQLCPGVGLWCITLQPPVSSVTSSHRGTHRGSLPLSHCQSLATYTQYKYTGYFRSPATRSNGYTGSRKGQMYLPWPSPVCWWKIPSCLLVLSHSTAWKRTTPEVRSWPWDWSAVLAMRFLCGFFLHPLTVPEPPSLLAR